MCNALISRQAVPRAVRHAAYGRFVGHLVLTTVVGAVATTVVGSRPTTRVEPTTPAERPSVAVGLVGMPASPPREWMPVRGTVATVLTTIPELVTSVEQGSADGTIVAPLEAQPISDEAVALGDSAPAALVSTRERALWSDGAGEADAVGRVPRLAVLEPAGPARDGRIPVRLDLPDAIGRSLAWVDAAAVTPTGHLGLAGPWARPFAFGLRTVSLDVPYRTPLDGSAAAGANCGPASLGMILDSFGIAVPTATLRERAHRFQGTSGLDTGFLLEVLEQVVESYGLEGQALLKNRRYRGWTLDDVRRHLRAGHPVILQLRYRLMPGREWASVSYDHYLVLTGIDGDDFLFNDPIPWSGKGQGRITAAQLLRAWGSSDAPMAALAVADPR